MCIYIYTYIYTYIRTYVYIHIYVTDIYVTDIYVYMSPSSRSSLFLVNFQKKIKVGAVGEFGRCGPSSDAS